MLYATSWEGIPAVRNTATERLLESGGGPPEGAKMLGLARHWTDLPRRGCRDRCPNVDGQVGDD
jgi:hypothetical protein